MGYKNSCDGFFLMTSLTDVGMINDDTIMPWLSLIAYTSVNIDREEMNDTEVPPPRAAEQGADELLGEAEHRQRRYVARSAGASSPAAWPS